MNTTTALRSKPEVGSTVTAIRDIVRGEGTPWEVIIAKGTILVVTDTMQRKGYDKPDRIGVKLGNGGALGVVLGVDVR